MSLNSDFHGNYPSIEGWRLESRQKGGAFSPPLAMLELAWKFSLEKTGHSWTRLNAGLRSIVRHMIEIGMPFDLGDFAWIREHYSSGHWTDFEGWYSSAVQVRNNSACLSIEQKFGRKPFILNGQRLAVGVEVCGICDKSKMRSEEWRQLEWAILPRVKVTSFSDDQLRVNLTISERQDPESNTNYGMKVSRRFALTHEDIAKANALIRSDKKAAKTKEIANA